MNETKKHFIFAGILFLVLLFIFIFGNYYNNDLEKNHIHTYGVVESFGRGHKGRKDLKVIYYTKGGFEDVGCYISREDPVNIGDSIEIIYSTKDNSVGKILKDKGGFVITKPKPQPEIFLENFEEIKFDSIKDSLFLRYKK